MPSLRGSVRCYGCLVFLDRPERRPAQDKQQAEAAKGASNGVTNGAASPASPSEGREKQKDIPASAKEPAVQILNKYAEHKRANDNAAAAALLAEDATWVTIYAETIRGRAAILEWMENETRKGRRNRNEQPWLHVEGDASSFKREMMVTFPSKATHEVVQVATVEGGAIKMIEVRPKYPALATAIAFAMARANGDDAAALAQMSQEVVWKTWDGSHIDGKDAVRKLFREQKGREVKREGTTEFEAAQVNEVGGVFERSLLIERVDAIKVKTKQRLYVKGELTQVDPVSTPDGKQRSCWGMVPKIVEVHVLTCEEMVDGKWVKTQSAEDL